MILIVKNENYFNGNLSENSSYLLGLLLADGGFEVNKPNKLSFVSIDKSLIDFVREQLGITNKVMYKPPGVETIQGRIVQCKPKYSLYFYSSFIVKSLQELGVSIKGRSFDFSTNKIKHKDYLRGFLDGDGCITHGTYKSKGAMYLSVSFVGSLSMMEDLKFYLRTERGLSSLISKCSSQKIVQLHMKKRSSLHFCEWIYKDASMFLERKYNKYYEVIVDDKNRKHRHYDRKVEKFYDSPFSISLRKIIKDNKLSYKEAAAILGVSSDSLIHNWIWGKYNPSQKYKDILEIYKEDNPDPLPPTA